MGNEAEYYFNLGVDYYYQGLLKEALEAFDRAIEIDPNIAPPWHGKGNVYDDLGEYQKALLAFDRAIEIDPNIAAPWDGKGVVYDNLGEYQKALQAYDRAIEIDPNFTYPWNGKGNVYNTLENISQAQVCYLRFYKLLRKKPLDINIFKALPTLLNFYDEKSSAPYIVFRIFNIVMPYIDFSIIEHSSFMRLYIDVKSQCEKIIRLLKYIKDKKVFENRYEKLKLVGLILYYMGDPIKSSEIFNKMDDEYEDDLLGQYYLIQSLNNFGENATKEIEFAIETAKKIINEKNDNLSIQFYYAGQLFYLEEVSKSEEQRNFSNIITLFEKAYNADEEFLPALYMKMLCLHHEKLNSKKDNIIRDILHKEHLLYLEEKCGFLGNITFEEIDITSEHWNKPFIKYANLIEISESIQVFYNCINQNEEKYVTTLSEKEFLEKYYDTKHVHAWEAWMFNEDMKQEFKKDIEITSQKKLELLESKLKSFYPDIPFIRENPSKEALEGWVASYIDNAGESIVQEEKYLLLITYYYYSKRLSAQSYMLLYFYIKIKKQIFNKGNLSNVFFTDALKTFLKSFAGTFGASMIFEKNLVITSFVAGLIALFTQYLLSELLNNPELQKFEKYSYFKSHFIDFIGFLIEKEGEDFREKYHIENVDELINF